MALKILQVPSLSVSSGLRSGPLFWIFITRYERHNTTTSTAGIDPWCCPPMLVFIAEAKMNER